MIRLGLHTGSVLNGEVGREFVPDNVGKDGGGDLEDLVWKSFRTSPTEFREPSFVLATFKSNADSQETRICK